MHTYLLAIALLASMDVCQSEPVHLRCSTLGDSAKVYAFQIDIDAEKKEVFVDGQYTSLVSISPYLTRFVLASGDDGYHFDIYPNGMVMATRSKNGSTLLLQCA